MGGRDSSFGGQGIRIGEFGNTGAAGTSHLIRSAEKLASSGRFEFALEQLSVAQRLDPGNRYIQAITDRIRSAQNHTAISPNAQKQKDNYSQFVTIGRQFEDGIKGSLDHQEVTPDDVPARIRFLTNIAEQYLENGASEKAFESLMNAYLLDPLSPYVIASEKAVLPAWESTRRNPSTKGNNVSKGSIPMSNSGTSNMSSSNPFSQGTPSTPPSGDDQIRVDILMQKKEQERLEKERSIWREASRAPKVFGEDEHPNTSSTPEVPSEQPKPHQAGLFSRLRLGKFLE